MSREAPVEIVAYDPSWPIKFLEEAAILHQALGAWVVGPIEHIGSTAVPGLAAKPVIDIMAGVESLEASHPAIQAAGNLGYCYFPYQAHLEHWFCKPSPSFRTHHLHLIPIGTPQWTRAIAFRDYLRAHSHVAEEYALLKQRLAQEHRFDREAYTDAKRPFIDRVIHSALKMASRHVILTGGPGAGKTTLLVELAARGYATVEESARAVIAERLVRDESPRPDPVAFAQAILRRDIEKYLNRPRTSDWVFFDRGLIDALGMRHETSPLTPVELQSMLASYPFHPTVFVLPPWEAIYATDAERDQTFAQAADVYAKVVGWYRACGFVLNEVPCLPVAQRAEHVLRILADSA
jgi:GrpB-like predicted nucleotidyltransferase (UPF0157 family)